MVRPERGVWHSPQWPTARTRYSPRATPETGAADGGVSLEAKVMSHAGRNTLSNIGMVIFFAGVGLLAGGTLRRNFTSAARSSSAMPLNDVKGWTGRMRSPLGRRPRRMAVMICASVQLPIPAFGSGVMLLEYTVPNGPSYLRPPALRTPFGSVWQPQPPVAPKTYLPRASWSGSAARASIAEPRRSRIANSIVITVTLQTSVSPRRFPRSALGLLPAIRDVVLLLVPERPVVLRHIAREGAIRRRRARRRHQHLLRLGQAPLPGRGGIGAPDHGEPVMGPHENGAVAVQPEAYPAVTHRHARRPREHLDGRLGVRSRRDGDPQPASIEPRAHGLRLGCARGRRHEKHLRQGGEPDGVASHRAQGCAHAGAGTNAVPHLELVAQVDGVPLAVAPFVPVRLAAESDHGRGQLARLRQRPRRSDGEEEDEQPGREPCAHDHDLSSTRSIASVPSSVARASRRRPRCLRARRRRGRPG